MSKAQETFDKVIAHLVKQGVRAYEPNRGCNYRTSAGLRCAVGFLIPDELYLPEMERQGVRSLCGNHENIDTLLRELCDNLGLLSDLQRLHDSFDSWNRDVPGVSRVFWEQARSITADHGLTLDNVKHLNVYA